MSVFKKWLESDTGKKCMDWYSLRFSKEPVKYLENRLYHAYSAGMLDEYSRNKELQLTIDWYEQKKREADKLIKELQSKVHQQQTQPPQQQESEP